jgi:hypothetical protein
MHSLTSSTIHKLLNETLPRFQATSPSDANIGFGFLYYGLVRAVRPKTICVIWSKAGFSVITFALAIKDNAASGIKAVTCWNTELSESGPGGHFFYRPFVFIRKK